MTSKTFGKKLRKLIESSGEFETDLIEMADLLREAKKDGFDDIIYVAGENEDEVFILNVLKIK